MATDLQSDLSWAGWQRYATTAVLLLVAASFYARKLAWRRLAQNRPDGIEVLVPVEDAEIDIVAVHGLGAHPTYTWTARVKAASTASPDKPQHRPNWLKDEGFLKSDFPKARIMTFCYNADWLLQAPAATAEQRARTLLRELKRAREGIKSVRPIIFCGHSYGGIIIKIALCEAEMENKYEKILKNTRGVIFLGTPHQGSAAASWAALAVSALSYVPYLGSKATVLRLLCSHSDQLSLWRTRFSKTMSRQIPKTLLYSIIETRETFVCGFIPLGLVVGQDSGTIESGIDPIEIDGSHTDLNKCRSNEDRLYKEIRDLIRDVVDFSASYDRTNNERMIGSERAECLRSLALKAPNPRQADESIDQAVRQTGKEVFEQPAYHRWAQAEGSDILWLVGKPGTGKSTFLLEALRRSQQRTGQPGLEEMLEFDRTHSNPPQTKQQNKSMPLKKIVASYFYNFRDKGGNEVHVSSMLQSLLFQILYQEARVFPLFQKTFSKYKANGPRLSMWSHDDLRTVFASIINLQDRELPLNIELFIDALDESEQSVLVFRLINGTISAAQEKSVAVKALVACRDMQVLLEIPEDRQIHLEKHNSTEISSLINLGVSNIEKQLTRFYDKVHFARNTIQVERFKAEMSRRAQGTILWVSLALASVASDLSHGVFTIERMMSALDDIPSHLEDLYVYIIEKIKANGERSIADVRRWLQWAGYASCSLTVAEFFHAIAVHGIHEGLVDLQNNVIPHYRIEGIRATLLNCGGFLEVQRSSSETTEYLPHDFEVQIAHRSVFTFLSKPSAAPLQLIHETCHLMIVDASLDYLMIVLGSRTNKFSEQLQRSGWLSPVSTWRRDQYVSFVKHLNDHPLLSYVWSELMTHLEHLPLDCLPSRLERMSKISGHMSSEDASALLLQTWVSTARQHHPSGTMDSDVRGQYANWKSQIQASFRWVHPQHGDRDEFWDQFWGQCIAISIEEDCLIAFEILCHAGVFSLCKRGLQICVDLGVGSSRLSILNYIGRFHHPQGLQISEPLEQSLTNALSLACRTGRHAIVRWLLEVGQLWGWDCRDQSNASLFEAVRLDYLSIVRLLLDQGADPNQVEEHWTTPLHTAAKSGNADVAQLLLQRGAEDTIKDEKGRTALQVALQKGHESVARALWEVSKTSYVVSDENSFIMPLPPPRFFVGRESLLVKLVDSVNSSSFLALVGMAGIGKTILASHFAYSYKHLFSTVVWVKAKTYKTFYDGHQYAAARIYRQTLLEEPYRQSAIIELYGLLELREGSKLIVWDNLEDLGPLIRLPRKFQDVHVLVTTRNIHLAHDLCLDENIFQVPNFSLDESVEFLGELGLADNREPMELLAERVNNLPLALHAIAIRTQGTAPQQYLNELLSTSAANNSIDATYSLIIDELDGASVKLLSFISVLGPDFIPRFMLDAAEDILELTESGDYFVDEFFLKACRLALIEMREDPFDGLFMHGVVQDFLRRRQTFDELLNNQRLALRVVAHVFPAKKYVLQGNRDVLETCDSLLPHAQKVLAYDVAEEEELVRYTQYLLQNAGVYLAVKKQYVKAQNFLQRVYLQYTKRGDPLADEIMSDMKELEALDESLGSSFRNDDSTG